MLITSDEALKRNIALVQQWKDKGRVTASLSLRQILICSPDLIREVGALGCCQ